MPSYILILISLASLLLVRRLLARKLYKKIAFKNLEIEYLLKYKPATPQNTIITFDLHDVIVNYDYGAIAKTFLKGKHTCRLIIAMLNPCVWWSIAKLAYNNAVAEQYIIGIGQKHKSLTPFIPLGIEIANCQTTNPHMVKLLEDLKKRGFTLHLFSNIGEKIFEDLKAKKPSLIQYFDKIVLPSQQNGYLRKPNQDAFINYLNQSNNDTKQILFIDDKVGTTEKAESYGIIGIPFTSEPQLRELFIKLGML